MGTEDITITGTFTINSYNVTYMVDGVQYGTVESHPFNSKVTLRNISLQKKASYYIHGWRKYPDNFMMPQRMW